MEARIRTFEDLTAEKLRLQGVLAVQKNLIRQDITDLREELKPIKAVLGFAGKFVSKDKRNPVLNAGVDFIGDVLLKNLLFARSGFIVKWIAPYLIKNFSSNLLAGKETSIVNMIGEQIKLLIQRFRKQA